METQVNNLNGTNQQIVQKTTAINGLATTYEPSSAASALALTLGSLVTSKLSTNTRRAYEQDARQFVAWLNETGLSLKGLTLADMKQYRRYVSDKFAPASAARKLVVARRLLEEAVERGFLSHNPAHRLETIAVD